MRHRGHSVKRSVPRAVRRLLPAAWRAYARRNRGNEADETPFTSSEELERELVELGLSGRCFGASEYAEALGEYLGMYVLVHYLDDRADPVFRRRLALSRRLAETHHFARRRMVVVFVPSSLPSLVLELTVLHELAHLAAGDLTRSTGRERLATKAPHDDNETREEEADARALHVLMAGRLGLDNPYAQAVFEVP